MASDEERLIASLLNSGVLTNDQVEEARQQASASGTNVAQALLRMRLITAADIARAAADMPAAPAAEAPAEVAEAAPVPTTPTPRVPQAARPRTAGQASLANYTVEPGSGGLPHC